MPAVVSSSRNNKIQDVNHVSKSLEAGHHESSGAKLLEPDFNDIQTASINDAHIFVRACVVQKTKVPTEGMEETGKVADSTRGSQSTNATQTFQYDMKKLQKMFADMDNRLRSKKFSKFSHGYKKCPSRTLQEVETRSSQILQEGEKSFKRAESGSEPGENINPTAPNNDDRNSGTKDIPRRRNNSNSDIVGIDALIEHSRRQKKFVKEAKAVFAFFVPLAFTSALVAKYWGAVYVLIEVKAIFPTL